MRETFVYAKHQVIKGILHLKSLNITLY